MIASARKNGQCGYKALVTYAGGRTHIPVRKNFPSAEAARSYAQKWIDANLANHARQAAAMAERHEFN